MDIDTITLQKFPQKEWAEEPTNSWTTLCNQLQAYDCGGPMLTVKHLERKWELVSAYQKCVRRGDSFALQLVGTFLSFPEKERGYFWRRICTTAAEDVGYANPELMNFVIAASMTFGGKKVPSEVQYKVQMFLTLQMLKSQRSRIYCQLCIIEEMVRQGLTPTSALTEVEQHIVQLIAIPTVETPKQQWMEKNNWRGEGMLHFQAFSFYEEDITETPHFPPSMYLKGLPDFCYDKHTRVGKIACAMLAGHPDIKWYLDQAGTTSTTNRAEQVGWAVFFAEGGLIANDLFNPMLNELEAKYVARKFGWDYNYWLGLVKVVRLKVADGTLNTYRSKILSQQEY